MERSALEETTGRDYNRESRIGSIGGSVSSICKTLLSGRARWNAKQTDHVKEAEWNKQTRRSNGRRARQPGCREGVSVEAAEEMERER